MYRVCPVPGCPAITQGGYCEMHARQRRAFYGEYRPDRNARGYDSRWRRTRARFLARHRICERCGKPATEAHHRDGKGPLGPRGHDPLNLEALCKSCHSRIA